MSNSPRHLRQGPARIDRRLKERWERQQTQRRDAAAVNVANGDDLIAAILDNPEGGQTKPEGAKG